MRESEREEETEREKEDSVSVQSWVLMHSDQKPEEETGETLGREERDWGNPLLIRNKGRGEKCQSRLNQQGEPQWV